MSEDLTWFWAIVDKEGFANVPSSERDALLILSQKASESDALREENARLRKAVKSAYYEGWQDNASIDDTADRLHAEWEFSEAHAAIRGEGA